MSTIIKESTITSKGQITIPIEWRRRFGDAKKVVWKESHGVLTLEPSSDTDDANWTTVFDAKRDNNDKGIDGQDFLKMLEAGL